MYLGLHKFRKVLPAMLIIFIVVFVAAFLILRGSLFVESKLLSEIGGVIGTPYAIMQTLKEGNYSKLPSMLTPRFRGKVNDFIAEWKKATYRLGSIRSFGKLEGSINLEVYQGKRCLVFRSKQAVYFENGTLIVYLVSILKNRKWLVDMIDIKIIDENVSEG
jgi:hypothetical protein